MLIPAPNPDRIEALDVLRGIAVFGILMVNLEQMFIPEYFATDPIAVIPGEHGVWLAWGLTDALFENKFLTVFSLLFGVGFMLQWQRAETRPRGFGARFLRRNGVLFLFGAVHALFFYMADVLMIYALTVLPFYFFRKYSVQVLAITGSVLLGLVLVWGTFISGPEPMGTPALQQRAVLGIAQTREQGTIQLPSEPWRITGEDGLAESNHRVNYPLPLALEDAKPYLDGQNPVARAMVEYAVFSEGPIAAAVYSRWLFVLKLLMLYFPFYLFWRTLALFFIGAALVKGGLLHLKPSVWLKRAGLLFLCIGSPTTLAATILRYHAFDHPGFVTYAAHALHELSSLFLAAGLGAIVFRWCLRKAVSPFRRALAAVGRTALTNYIGQSAVMSLLATSYGLSLYGDLTRIQLLALGTFCFALQLVLSQVWLHFFRMGPLEWLWRCVTYGTRLPLKRQ